MSELTWSGTTPPHLKPHGDLILNEILTEKGRKLRILQADPRILVSAQLLDSFRAADWIGVTLDGDLLRVEDADRTVIYRIGEKVPDMFAYYAEWPD